MNIAKDLVKSGVQLYNDNCPYMVTVLYCFLYKIKNQTPEVWLVGNVSLCSVCRIKLLAFLYLQLLILTSQPPGLGCPLLVGIYTCSVSFIVQIADIWPTYVYSFNVVYTFSFNLPKYKPFCATYR